MIVPLTHVSFVNGFRSDVPAITRLAHERGAFVFLDGYQDCGTRPIDIKALGVDFYVTGTLKYLLGPPGLGFLYVRRRSVGAIDAADHKLDGATGSIRVQRQVARSGSECTQV